MGKLIYLKQNVVSGQRHFVMDPRNLKKKRPGYLLFPTKCLKPIPDEDAELLLEQNVNCLSTTPLKVKDDTPIVGEVTGINLGPKKNNFYKDTEEYKKPQPNQVTGKSEFVIDEDVTKALTDLAKMSDQEFKALSGKDITEYGTVLGITFKKGMKKDQMLRKINARCKELIGQVKQGESDYGGVTEQ